MTHRHERPKPAGVLGAYTALDHLEGGGETWGVFGLVWECGSQSVWYKVRTDRSSPDTVQGMYGCEYAPALCQSC
jgi:hypothetical protein